MKKLCFKLIFPLMILLNFAGCDNTLVQELMRTEVTLQNLSIRTADGHIYSSRPEFHKNGHSYVVRVPYETEDIQIMASLNKDAFAIYTANGATNNSGKFKFLDEEMTVRIDVQQKYFDPSVYILRIVRGSDSTLWDVTFNAKLDAGGGNFQNLPVQTMNPGFIPERYGGVPLLQNEYILYIMPNTTELTIEAVTRPNAEAEFCIINSLTDSTLDGLLGPYTLNDSRHNTVYALSAGFSAGAPVPGGFTKTYFKSSDFNQDIPFSLYIKVWMTSDDDPATAAELYKITVKWPKTVTYDSSVLTLPTTQKLYPSPSLVPDPDNDAVVIYGTIYDNKYYFNAGAPVSFKLTPPFGTRTKQVEWHDGTTWETLWPLAPPYYVPNITDTFSFVMPSDKAVKIRAVWEEVPGVSGIRYAYPGGTGTKDGLKWYNAKDINDLINGYDGSYEIWVAEGTYNPDPDTTVYPGATSFNRAFILPDGIKIYGGFTGIENDSEPYNASLAQAYLSPRVGRRYSDSDKTEPKYKSILSGNYDNGDKVYHTVVAVGSANETAYLDGLVIEGSANTYWSGTPPAINGHSPIIDYGGAFYVYNFSPVLKNVTIQDGYAPNAAGMFVYGSNSEPVLLHCRFTNNQSANIGSAIGIDSGVHLLMIGGKMDMNLDWGGVLNIRTGGKATMVNVLIDNNKENAVSHGGTGTGDFINCTITRNRGADLPNVVSTGTYYNCIIQNNTPQFASSKPALVFHNTYAEGYPGDAGSPSAAGNSSHYPLNSGGGWNTGAACYSTFTGTGPAEFGAHPYSGLSTLLIDALKLDARGNNRFLSAFKMGAIQ